MAVETRASAFQTAQRRFDAAADVIGLSDDARRSLREVKRSTTSAAAPQRGGSGTTPTSTSTSSKRWRC